MYPIYPERRRRLQPLSLVVCAALTACHVEPADEPDGFEPSPEFLAFVESYGAIETVAGAGLVDAEGRSDWQAHFEGGPARSAELSRPHTAMADAAGRIYIADKDAHAIRRVELDGTIHTHAGVNVAGDDGDDPAVATQAHLASPNGLWVRPDGVVYVLDTANGRVCRVGSDGMMRTLFRRAAGFGEGRGLWVAEDESLAYVAAGDSVVVWTPLQGDRVFATGFVELGAVMPDANGELVLCDRGANQVFRLSADGSERSVVAGSGVEQGRSSASAVATAMWGVRALWLREDGSLLLGTHEGSQLWFVDRAGQADLLLDGLAGVHAGDGSRLGGPGLKVSELRSVVITPAGDLLWVEHDTGFVRRARRR